MSNNLYLECYSGISGDMLVAALLDLGADQESLKRKLKTLPLSGYQIEISRVKKAGIDACDFNVILDQKYDNHDHDMKYLHGHEAEHSHGIEHSHEDGHSHEMEHSHGDGHSHEMEHRHGDGHSHEMEHGHGDGHSHEMEHGHGHEMEHSHEMKHIHEHRNMGDITRIINASELSDRDRELALRIFNVLAEAEAKAHGIPVTEVHFHEVGAVDSIIDIAAIAICLNDLEIKEVVVPVLYEGTGYIRCQHGVIPVPVPAVSNIITAHKIPLHITESKGEFVTPTGAAAVAAIRTMEKLPEQFVIKKIGIGAGKRNYERASILRAMLI